MRRRELWRAIAFTVFVSGLVEAQTQIRGCQFGTVRDQDGQPLPDATVTYRDSTGKSATTTMLENGVFIFCGNPEFCRQCMETGTCQPNPPAPGRVTFEISAPGCEAFTDVRNVQYDDSPNSGLEVEFQKFTLGCGGAKIQPTLPGPFGVGTTRITFTKSSETTGEPRSLDTVIWYPTEPGASPVDAFLGGVVDAPLSFDNALLPLLLFSHGSCGIPTQSVFLTAHLASHGFVVAAPPHPGNTFLEFPTCMDLAASQIPSFIERPADITFVIDRMLDQSADPASTFFGAIDPARIGVLGHSFGGLTTLRVAGLNPKVIAGLALAPALVPTIEKEVASIAIPIMIQGGESDTLTPFEDNQQAAFDLVDPPRFLLKILNTGHFAFSDICPGPGVFGVAFPECAPGTLTQDEAHRLVLRYATPFLKVWVAGDQRFAPFLDEAAAPAGVEFTADAP